MRHPFGRLGFSKKFTLLSTAVCGIGLAVVVTIITSLTGDFAKHSVIRSLQETTLERASLVRDEINAAIRETSALATAIEGLQRAGMVDRELYKALLRRFMEERPQYLGAFAAWEPSALDGRDAEFAGQPDKNQEGRADFITTTMAQP